MKTAIIYYSQHHGNTKKLLDAISDTDMTKDEMLAVSHIVVNDYECGELTCRRMDMRGRFLIALISQDGEIRKKANGLMQHIMRFCILGLRTCRMKRIK